MDTQTFANTIRSKYPDGVANDGTPYRDMPDEELTHRVVTKYPVYKEAVTDYKAPDKSFNAALFGNAPKTAANNKMMKMQGAPLAQNVVDHAVEGVKHPIETGKGFVKEAVNSTVELADLTSAGLQKAGVPEGTFITPTAEDVAVTQERLTPTNKAQETGSAIEKGTELYYGAKDLAVMGAKKVGPIIDDVLDPVLKKGESFLSSIKKKLTSTGLSKTPDEILATPSSKAHTLNATEREYYKAAQKEKLAADFEKKGTTSSKEFKAQQEAIDAEHNALEARTKADLARQTDEAEMQIQTLSKEVDRTAYNKTVELKPKAVKALGEQSRTYGRLIEEDLAPHVDVPVSQQDIVDVVNTALMDNPAMAEKIIAQVGKSKNVGELYNAIKGVKQDVSKAGLRGNRVYTADDMARDKVVGGLSDLLKEKGVDLSRANDFWRQWAPLRDKIVTKLKPFDTNNLETKTFSNILKNSGDDIHNENFIKEFENVLGEPITTETKTAIAKLSAAEKQKLAVKLDAEIKLEEAKILKESKLQSVSESKIQSKEKLSTTRAEAEEALKEKQYEIDRLAARRTAIRRIIKTTIGAGLLYQGNKILKESTGLGL